MSRKVPESHRKNPHKIEVLQKAVVGYAWAVRLLSRNAKIGLTFQHLYGEL